jgi:hypothetical protein
MKRALPHLGRDRATANTTVSCTVMHCQSIMHTKWCSEDQLSRTSTPENQGWQTPHPKDAVAGDICYQLLAQRMPTHSLAPCLVQGFTGCRPTQRWPATTALSSTSRPKCTLCWAKLTPGPKCGAQQVGVLPAAQLWTQRTPATKAAQAGVKDMWSKGNIEPDQHTPELTRASAPSAHNSSC